MLIDVHQTPTEEKEHPKSAESPAGTQISDTDASTLPSPEYTDVEADLEGMYSLFTIYSTPQLAVIKFCNNPITKIQLKYSVN